MAIAHPREIRIKLDKNLRLKSLFIGGEVPDETVESAITAMRKALDYRSVCTEERKKEGVHW